MLLAAEQAGRQQAATNGQAALRTPRRSKTIRKDQPGGLRKRTGGGHGSVGFPGLAPPWRVLLLALGKRANGASGCTEHLRKTHAKTTMQRISDEGKKDLP